MGEWVGESVGPDVWETCRELIPAGSVFAFLAGHRGALFPAQTPGSTPRAAALNLRRLINLGLTHTSGTWHLAPAGT